MRIEVVRSGGLAGIARRAAVETADHPDAARLAIPRVRRPRPLPRALRPRRTGRLPLHPHRRPPHPPLRGTPPHPTPTRVDHPPPARTRLTRGRGRGRVRRARGAGPGGAAGGRGGQPPSLVIMLWIVSIWAPPWMG